MADQYEPEGAWITEGNLVYNLHTIGQEKGKPVRVNDVAITIQRTYRLSKEDMEEMAQIIREALNDYYEVEDASEED